MKRETKKRLTAKYLRALVTSLGLVVQRIPTPQKSPTRKEVLGRR